MISTQTQIEPKRDLNLTNISPKLNQNNQPNKILKTTLTKLQTTLTTDLCGPRYQKNPDKQYKRAKTTTRTLQTRHGKIKIKLIRLYNKQTRTYISPLLLYLGILARQRMWMIWILSVQKQLRI
ncbi:MAG: hypothetical protein LBQ98_05375 [Nitrososphaerota archaeon]|jgi:hypothetical protein|nr:hypothetical protein [Nitrososphaerota archaeon]